MSKEIKHACKYCQRPVTLRIADGAEDLFSLDWWLSHASCNSCADFHNRRLTLCEYIMHHVMRARRTMKGPDESEFPDPEASERLSEEQKKAVMEHVRQRLTYWTKCYAKRVCDRERHVFAWEPSFVDLLLTRSPAKVPAFLEKYFQDFAPNTFTQWAEAKAKDDLRRNPHGQ